MEKVFLCSICIVMVSIVLHLCRRHQLLFITDPDEEGTAVTQRQNILKLSVKKSPPPHTHTLQTGNRATLRT